jgi:hypothetical protein
VENVAAFKKGTRWEANDPMGESQCRLDSRFFARPIKRHPGDEGGFAPDDGSILDEDAIGMPIVGGDHTDGHSR